MEWRGRRGAGKHEIQETDHNEDLIESAGSNLKSIPNYNTFLFYLCSQLTHQKYIKNLAKTVQKLNSGFLFTLRNIAWCSQNISSKTHIQTVREQDVVPIRNKSIDGSKACNNTILTKGNKDQAPLHGYLRWLSILRAYSLRFFTTLLISRVWRSIKALTNNL